MSAIIRVRDLTKSFKDVKAVNGLSFTVPSGEIYGFLGQNGAGKSTSIRMLLTLITPDSGEIEIFGMDLKKHRKQILQNTGAIIERPDLYKYLTAKENVQIFSAISGVKVPSKRIMDQLEMVGLAERANSKVRTFSQGMKQRLGLAIALVHDPQLIILDEPTNGLDPQGIADIRNLVLHLSKDLGKTIFVSSHLLSEIELVADSMLIIDKGKKIAEGKANELFDPGETIVEVKAMDHHAAYEKLQQSPQRDLLLEKKSDSILLKLHRSQVPAVMKELVLMDIAVTSFHSKNSLEDYFLSLTSANQHVEAFKN